MSLTILSARTSANSSPSNTNSSGTIVTPAGSSITDGEYFTIYDGLNEVRFEFDSNASVVQTDVLRRVTYSGASTASQVGDAIVTALAGSTIARTTGSNASGTVTVTKTYSGPTGNNRITENVANAGFTVASFTGGLKAGVSLRRDGWQGQDFGVIQLALTGTGAVDCKVDIWAEAEVLDKWTKLGSLNNGSSISGTNSKTWTETVRGVSAFSRIYAEVVEVNGTGAAVTVIMTERNI